MISTLWSCHAKSVRGQTESINCILSIKNERVWNVSSSWEINITLDNGMKFLTVFKYLILMESLENVEFWFHGIILIHIHTIFAFSQKIRQIKVARYFEIHSIDFTKNSSKQKQRKFTYSFRRKFRQIEICYQSIYLIFTEKAKCKPFHEKTKNVWAG